MCRRPVMGCLPECKKGHFSFYGFTTLTTYWNPHCRCPKILTAKLMPSIWKQTWLVLIQVAVKITNVWVFIWRKQLSWEYIITLYMGQGTWLESTAHNMVAMYYIGMTPYCCKMLHIGAYWCILVHIGAYWCILVHTGAYWCKLLHIAAYWCILVHIGKYWDATMYWAYWCKASVSCFTSAAHICLICISADTAVKYSSQNHQSLHCAVCQTLQHREPLLPIHQSFNPQWPPSKGLMMDQ